MTYEPQFENPPATGTIPRDSHLRVMRAITARPNTYARWPSEAPTDLALKQQVTVAANYLGLNRPKYDVSTRLVENTGRYRGWVRYSP